MSKNGYDLLVKLFVGVLKHQAKTLLGEDVLEALAEAGSEHLGDKVLEVLQGEKSTRERAERITEALRLAADELEAEEVSELRLDDAPEAIVGAVVDALANIETGDLLGRHLQSAIQDLVAFGGSTDPQESLRVSIKLYQAVLMAVLVVPELQPRAQDLLLQSRMWLLSEQIRRLEAVSAARLPTPAKSPARIEVHVPPAVGESPPKDSVVAAGDLIANGTIELVAEVARGGQGLVWRGKVLATGHQVAIKILDPSLIDVPEAVRAFEREATIGKSLSATAAIDLGYSDAVVENGRHYYVRDFVDQAVAMSAIAASTHLPVREKIKLLLQVADAVGELHNAGFVHGDVKPSNVLTSASGQVSLIDFGSARRIGVEDGDETLTFTYAYAAPELTKFAAAAHESAQTGSEAQTKRGKLEVGPWCDTYSLGVMLFQLVDPGLWSIGRMEERGLIDRLVVSDALKDVLRKALTINARERYRSAADFKFAVQSAIGEATSRAA